MFFFFNDTATTEIYTLSLHDALPIFGNPRAREGTITYAGRDITRVPTHEIARLSIAQAPEGRRIFPRMTVYENLQMGASVNGFAHFEPDLERICAVFP